MNSPAPNFRAEILLAELGENITTADELASRVGVCVRTVYRYVRELRAAGHHIMSEAGVGYMMRRREKEKTMGTTQFWLAELDQYGNAKLNDGPHSDRNGVEQAFYLIGRLGLGKGKVYACAEVILTPVEAKSHGANEEALSILNSLGLRP